MKKNTTNITKRVNKVLEQYRPDPEQIKELTKDSYSAIMNNPTLRSKKTYDIVNPIEMPGLRCQSTQR